MKTVNKDKIKQILKELGDVKLVGATKYFSIEEMKELQKNHICCFGENRVQDLLAKYDSFDDVEWHFIGTLQKNKVKYIIDKVSLIHSVDSISLMNEINKQANKKGIVVDILIQVNIAKEESKHGFYQEELDDVIKESKNYPNIRIKGFMMIAPFVNKEQTIIYFKEMNALYLHYQKKDHQIDTLSMGMSNDYDIAISFGATMVRIGSLLFSS